MLRISHLIWLELKISFLYEICHRHRRNLMRGSKFEIHQRMEHSFAVYQWRRAMDVTVLQAFPLSARIYDDSQRAAASRCSSSGHVLFPRVSAASSFHFALAVWYRSTVEAHELFSRLWPWENTRVAPVGIVNAAANCARRRRRRRWRRPPSPSSYLPTCSWISPFFFVLF